MGTQSTRGFTIIETMLFLAISGVLIVAMIAGTGASINIQRYRDAVETFKAMLQEQYSELSSVHNDRDNSWSCNDQAQTEQDAGQVRGQSGCMLMGRYLAIDASTITTHSIVGVQTSSSTSGTDIDKLRTNYQLAPSTLSSETLTMEWATQIAWPSVNSGVTRALPTTPRTIAILFLRSPDSGQIFTFTSDNAPIQPSPQNLVSMIVAGRTTPGQAEQTICIDSNGLFVTSESSVFINAYATGPTSIETRSNDFIQSLQPGDPGASTQC